MSGPTRVVLVPGTLALLPEYASLVDPVADLRAACLAAVSWLGPEVEVLADSQGHRVAEALLAATVEERRAGGAAYLVVGNGSNCRTEKAPGFLDPRGEAFDRDLRGWLAGEGPPLDVELGDAVGASLTGLVLMAERLRWAAPEAVDYDDDPFGVQYWVMRWTCAD